MVFCNCDDPYESNFFKYFAINFNFLGLKKLIATCYAGSPVAYTEFNDLPLFKDKEKSKTAYKVEITEVHDENGDGAVDMYDVELLLKNMKNKLTILDGNGDFRSPEAIECLKEADVVVTNPPFSLFREYVAQLINYNKNFIIIGNLNAVTYKEIFPLIKDNKVWLGQSIHSGDREFRIPDDYPLTAANFRVDEEGKKYIRVKGVRWYTNVDFKERHDELILYKHYTPEEYPKYDNYDAINVDKTAEIPCDYFENIGVPITYMDKHNPDQFEIINANDIRRTNDIPVKKHGLIKDGEATITSGAKSEREREENNICQNRHQTRCLQEQTDGTSTESANTQEYLSEERCSGVMGVPITFLDKYNPDQFEIIDINPHFFSVVAQGMSKPKQLTLRNVGKKDPYARILIKRKAKQ